MATEHGLGRAASARSRPDRRLRALRLLPADVPELLDLRGRDGLAARPHRAHARRQRGGLGGVGRDARAPRPLPRLHGLRDRLPVGRPVRQADRAGAPADRAQRAAPAARAAAPAPDLRALHPPGAAARAGAGAVGAAEARDRTTRSPRGWTACPSCRPCSGWRRRSRAGPRSQQLPEVTPARGTRRGRIALMQGCVQRVFFGDVNAATVRVLSAEGWEVHAPRQPRCCGSLQMHAGVEEEALDAGAGRRSPPTRTSRTSRSTSRAAARA